MGSYIFFVGADAKYGLILVPINMNGYFINLYLLAYLAGFRLIIGNDNTPSRLGSYFYLALEQIPSIKDTVSDCTV